LIAARRVSPATALFAVAAATSGILLLVWQSHLTFFYDDWDPLLHRRGLSGDALFRPHIDHILLATTVVYKAIQATIGMESLLPFAVASTSTFLLSVVLLFVYLRHRVGEWFALAGVGPILFLGSANTDLLLPFQIFFFGAMACGLGALLIIQRRDHRLDGLACVLLVVSFSFSELALPFLLGIAVAIAQDRGPLRRAYVVVVPALLYAAWYAGWGHTAPSYLSFDNVARSLPYVLDGVASGLASLLGLTPDGFISGSGLDWGRPLLLAVLVGVALRVRSGAPISRWFWVTLVILLSFWFLTAINATFARPPSAPRYQYIAAVLILLVAADLAGGTFRPRTPLIIVALGVATMATVSNLAALHDGYLRWRAPTPAVRGGLAGLEMESDRVDPALVLDAQNSGFNYIGSIQAGPYLSAVRAFGSPAYSESELPAAPEHARAAADKVMATALGVAVRPTTHRPAVGRQPPSLLGSPESLVRARGACITVRPSGLGVRVLSLPPGGVLLTAPSSVTARLGLRRFATESFPVTAGELTGSTLLTIPADGSSHPWQLALDATGPVTACGTRTD